MVEVLQCETIQNCPFCDQEGIYITPLLKDRIFGVAGSWRYRQCPHCNLIWLSPRPTRETYHLAYQNYHTHSIATNNQSFSIKMKRFKKMLACSIAKHSSIKDYNGILRCVTKILGFYPPVRELARSSCLWLDINKKGKLLDVGCGNGLFLAYMKEFGWTVYGIDPDNQAADFARNHFGIDVTVGSLRKGMFPENSFDAVTINHVIEHVHDPVETIEEAWRVLKKDGRLVITTPNMGSISRKLFRNTWRGLEVPRHLWLFTPETLAICATRAGLSDYKLATTARSAAGIFLESLEIKKRGCLPGGHLKRANWLARIGSFAYYNCVYMLNSIIRKIGDELVFTAVKSDTDMAETLECFDKKNKNCYEISPGIFPRDNKVTMKIFDTFLFFNELDLLELRLNTLNDIVDYFVITEVCVTFSGKPKPFYYEENKARFKDFEKKIIYNRIDSIPNDFSGFVSENPYYTNRFASYPHKSNGTPLCKLSLDFQREVFQRDSIINGLIDVANKEDLIIISDLDEIPNPDAIREVIDNFEPEQIYNFCQKWYMYYFNVFYSNEWFGTRICNFDYLTGKSVDLLRYHLENRSKQPGPVIENGGWHFNFLGGPQKIREKLTAYSYQGRRTKLLLKFLDSIYPNRIRKKIEKNLDIFNTGRKFVTVPIDETFPAYLVANQDKFRELIK